MNSGGGRRQQQAPQSRVAAAPLNLVPRLAAVGHEDDLARLPGLGPTAAVARRVSPDRPAAPVRVRGHCSPSRERS
jgi:hypothetical protein